MSIYFSFELGILRQKEREDIYMQLVKYRKNEYTKNEGDVKNLVDGKFYWIDEASEVEKDYRIFVDVYTDENKITKIGCVEKYLFLNVSKLVEREETVVEVTKKAPYYDSYYCPVCGDYVEPDNKYCPHCGSVMGWKILD